MISNVNTRIEKAKLKIAAVESGSNIIIVEEKPPLIPQPPIDLSIETWVTQIKQKVFIIT